MSNNNYNIDKVIECIDILNNSKDFNYGEGSQIRNGIIEILGYKYPEGLQDTLLEIFEDNNIDWNLDYQAEPETWNLDMIHSYIFGCVRAERFGDGALLSQIKSGKLLKVLNILKNKNSKTNKIKTFEEFCNIVNSNITEHKMEFQGNYDKKILDLFNDPNIIFYSVNIDYMDFYLSYNNGFDYNTPTVCFSGNVNKYNNLESVKKLMEQVYNIIEELEK